MLLTLAIVLPIFALIAAGFAAQRMDILGLPAVRELNRFVVYLALPALLFDVMANATWSALYQPRFIAAFGLSCGALFYATLLLRMASGRGLADASIDAINASYANTAYLGIPLCVVVLGPDSLVLVTIASIITVCVLFASAIVLIEFDGQAERRPLHLVAKVALSLARNPLIMAPALGALYAASGLHVPAPVATFLKLLGAAASPCALVALGLFLAERRESGAMDRPPALALTGAKLIGHPLIAWLLAAQVFQLEGTALVTAVLLSALPTGTGPFMLAELYRRDAGITARTIFYSTVAGLITVTVVLALTGR